MIDFVGVLEKFKKQFANEIVHQRIIAARPPKNVSYPDFIPDELREALNARGIELPYSHQAEAWQLLSQGKSIVVITPTASGKTLCYNVPVVRKILEEPSTRALYLFPTKALSQDQLAELQGLLDHAAPEAKAFTFDGDTPADARQAIRAQGHIVITNPDMLHSGILPHHVKWQKMFENLKFIVLDELHSYRGVFGSHVTNVVRRLRRICEFYGSKPQFICCSATIANPKEHAEQILELPVDLVSTNGAPSGEKHFIFLNPPVVNPTLGIRRSYVKQSQAIANFFLDHDLHTIVFAPSRLIMEILLTYLQERQTNHVLKQGEVRGYRGGYLPSVRREIEAGLRAGEIRGVVCTNALELGIDIGSLDASVLAGYPGTISSSWQQAGRSGRRDRPSITVLVASSSPVDQFLMSNPEYFFGASPEFARTNPDNLHILVDHVKCAAFELPFRGAEEFGKEELAEILGFLKEEGFVHQAGDAHHWINEAYPANAVSLRRITSDNFLVVDTSRGDEIIAEVDFGSALTTLHEKAIYMCEGNPYYVDRLDFEGRKAQVRPVEADYYTDAITYMDVKVLEIFEQQDSEKFLPSHGDIQITEEVVGFKKLKLFTLENVGSGELSLPEHEWHTTSFWFSIPREVLGEAPFDSEEKIDGVRGLAYALRGIAVISLMCDLRDLGVSVVDTLQDHKIYQRQLRRPETADPSRIAFQPNIYLYDKYPGGIGFSKTLFDQRHNLVSAVETLVRAIARVKVAVHPVSVRRQHIHIAPATSCSICCLYPVASAMIDSPQNLNQYEPIVGSETIDRITTKSKRLRGHHAIHISSTYYGGGVANLLDPLSVLMNRSGLKAEWRIIQGAPDFFSITKKIHNALQGGNINLTELKMSIYEKVIEKNAIRTHMDGADFVVIHDPQPLAMIRHYKKECPWIWQCHLDLSEPNKDAWNYLVPFIKEYDVMILSTEDYKQSIDVPQKFFFPAIDPFSITNIELDEDAIKDRLEHYRIPDDLPLVAQISRFDRWKDPEGVIQAFKIARKKVDCTLVLVGNIATDDPEGQEVYESLMGNKEERIIILSVEDTALVNALQRKAEVILQKSIREGFGLTVTEAMFKGTAVIGGNVGGIRYQIQNGVNGFLVSSVEETAERLVELLQNEKLRKRLGKEAMKTVREKFLITRLLEQYLDLFNSFEMKKGL